MADSYQASFFESYSEARENDVRKPLAARMRPRNLSEIIGQSHLMEANALLPKLIKADRIGSLLLWGPPGCGKTSIARVIAAETDSHFVQVNAVLSNVAELKQILLAARRNPSARTILFIDELHRFNKAQQDLLLPDVEEGNVRLIGVTTHNPGFYIIPPLVSRSHLFRLEPLKEDDVAKALKNALQDTDRGLGERKVTTDDELLVSLARLCDGDLRRALNALEVVVESVGEGHTLLADDVQAFARERQIRYDADEDEHYNTASAMIKSMRGGDPDAALYWMAKMLVGGEDPRFIARRLVILASEDVGLADPMALLLAVAAKDACEFLGQPECELNLAHAVIYLATAPKSNSVTLALGKAKKEIQENPLQEVPLWLRDSHSKVSKNQGHGDGYLYSHDFPEAISGQEYLLKPTKLYEPTASGREKFILERLRYWRELKAELETQN
ncbi:MAG: ATPase [Opitutaceae bacterium]|nr:ATPase [Opitutaceae bacterium]